MSRSGDHWERIYATRSSTEVSWYEREPATSLRLIETLAPEPDAAVIDIGAGASLLVDRLAASGLTDLTILDISQRSLDNVRQRLGPRARAVSFLHNDVLTWEPDRQYDVWHDRAVFHFLTEPSARTRYVDVAAKAVRDGGAVIIGAFAEDGPTQCSGLPVARYSPVQLASTFSQSFSLVQYEREEHVTPGGDIQPFTWVALRRI
jgi:2-polyprenyl-3-methyl-5-hydroxy-6-metoxy-1,4-benzoquinol methylase